LRALEANITAHQMMARILNIADQTIVPAPNEAISSPTLRRANTEVKNSGAELQIAIRVAQATSLFIFSFLLVTSSAGTNILSTRKASQINVPTSMRMCSVIVACIYMRTMY